jgi:hypothetical protein
VRKTNDPDSLHIACALGTRDGMDTMEYRSRTKRQGFRFSRDDYWRANSERSGRQDYCRIIKDAVTGEFHTTCAIAGRDGFKAKEERDTNPPAAIRELLEAYDGIQAWWRWRDDMEDYAQNAAFTVHGRPELPQTLGQTVSRGLQLNRGSTKAVASDYLRWGEKGTLSLDQDIAPRQIRAICFWVYWDALEKKARVFESSNGGKKDLMWLGIEGGGADLPPAVTNAAIPAQEFSPQSVLAIGQLTEPALAAATQGAPPQLPLSQSARYVFEIWDEEQRLMRLASPMGSVVPGVWQHVVVTTTDTESWWPTWQMWIDGVLVATRTDGRLSTAMSLTQNVIGRNVRGCLQDFRVYRKPLTAERIAAAIAWSRPHLHPSP